MPNDERVEAAARAVWKHATKDVNGRIDEASCTRVARRALSAAGVDALEAENARLREAVSTYDGFAVRYSAAAHRIEAECEAARRELAYLRAAIKAVADDARQQPREEIAPVRGVALLLDSLLAAAPSEPAPTDEDRHGAWDKSAQRYEDGCREDRPHPQPAPEARPVVVSAEQYDRAVEDATLVSVAEDAGCFPSDLLDHVISALGITVTKDAS